MEEIVAVVDKNGELIEIPEGSRVAILDNPGDRIVRCSSIRGYAKSKDSAIDTKIAHISLEDKAMWKTEHYAVVNTDELYLLCRDKTLNAGVCGLIMTLIPYVKFETCRISYVNGNKMSMKGLCEISGLSYKTAKKYINDLHENQILGFSGGSYYMNPWVLHRGTIIDMKLYEMFKDYYIRSRRMYWHEFVCL